MSRLDALHALAFTLPDVQPGPKAASSGASRGEVASGWALCDGCGGEGHTRDRFGRPGTCLECSGAGRFRVDTMTGRRVGSEMGLAPAPSRRVRCDRCHGGGLIPGRYVGEVGLVRCLSCDGAGSLSVPVQMGEETPGGPKVKVGGLRDGGDWDALEKALAKMNVIERSLWVPRRVGADGPNDWLLSKIDHAVLLHMPQRIRVPAWAWACWKDRHRRRDVAEAARKVRVYEAGSRSHKRFRAAELVRLGYTVAEAAELAGCSVRTVQRAVAA